MYPQFHEQLESMYQVYATNERTAVQSRQLREKLIALIGKDAVNAAHAHRVEENGYHRVRSAREVEKAWAHVKVCVNPQPCSTQCRQFRIIYTHYKQQHQPVESLPPGVTPCRGCNLCKNSKEFTMLRSRLVLARLLHGKTPNARHAQRCSDPRCTVEHCLPSRSFLKHFKTPHEKHKCTVCHDIPALVKGLQYEERKLAQRATAAGPGGGGGGAGASGSTGGYSAANSSAASVAEAPAALSTAARTGEKTGAKGKRAPKSTKKSTKKKSNSTTSDKVTDKDKNGEGKATSATKKRKRKKSTTSEGSTGKPKTSAKKKKTSKGATKTSKGAKDGEAKEGATAATGDKAENKGATEDDGSKVKPKDEKKEKLVRKKSTPTGNRVRPMCQEAGCKDSAYGRYVYRVGLVLVSFRFVSFRVVWFGLIRFE
jgi:hypothetical protein